MIELNEDISKLTNIPKQVLDKISTLSISCICDAIEDDILNDVDVLTIDIGIGQLMVKHTDNEMRYKFIPNAKLEEAISQTIINDKNTLKITIEDTLKKRIMSIYKELL